MTGLAAKFGGSPTSLALGLPIASLCLLGASPAHAYIGPSFLKISEIEGSAESGPFKGWTRVESAYWNKEPRRAPPLYEGISRLFFSGPLAPRSGTGQLAIAIPKRSADYARLMTLCRKNIRLGEIVYAESSDRARPHAELGRRPASIPEYFEYTLKNVVLSCPIVAKAPDQAFVLNFADISWNNYAGDGEVITTSPAPLTAAQSSGRSLAYIVDWLWSANNVGPNQCPVMSKPPSEADYYALMPRELAEKQRADFASKGGVLALFQTGVVAARGPNQLNVALLPGIVADPGHPAPQLGVARGFDLNGDGGKRPNGKGAQRKTYVSPTGQLGIDNQLFTIDGCIKGFGPDGILTVTTMEARRNGESSMMILISGIDDERNDDHVDITLFFSKDPMVKSANGKEILPGFTFRLTQDPQRTPYFQRLKGRVENGIVTTEPVELLELDKGRDTTRLFGGRMRLDVTDRQKMKGVIGGYQDIYAVANYWGSITFFETGMGYSMPGVYDALKRAADGLPDPGTGDFTGISSAFDVEGVAAFIPPEELSKLLAADFAHAN